jgi:hypothetical protein
MGDYGQLGDGNPVLHSRLTPYLVSALNGKKVIAISAGYYHSMVLTGK